MKVALTNTDVHYQLVTPLTTILLCLTSHRKRKTYLVQSRKKHFSSSFGCLLTAKLDNENPRSNRNKFNLHPDVSPADRKSVV